MKTGNRVVVIAPTTEEAAGFEAVLPSWVRVVIGGVGMAETAARAVRVVREYSPEVVILAGIAGAYPCGGLKVGDCVVVGSETVGDQGAFRDGQFTSLYAKRYECPYAASIKALPVVEGCSVNSAAATFFEPGDAKVESMEGAAFFSVCSALGVKFLEVRAVSNLTTASRGEWRMDEAVAALAVGLKAVIDEIEA